MDIFFQDYPRNQGNCCYQ